MIEKTAKLKLDTVMRELMKKLTYFSILILFSTPTLRADEIEEKKQTVTIHIVNHETIWIESADIKRKNIQFKDIVSIADILADDKKHDCLLTFGKGFKEQSAEFRIFFELIFETLKHNKCPVLKSYIHTGGDAKIYVYLAGENVIDLPKF